MDFKIFFFFFINHVKIISLSPIIVGIFIFSLAEKLSCSAMLSKKKIAIVNNLRFISRTIFLAQLR